MTNSPVDILSWEYQDSTMDLLIKDKDKAVVQPLEQKEDHCVLCNNDIENTNFGQHIIIEHKLINLYIYK